MESDFFPITVILSSFGLLLQLFLYLWYHALLCECMRSHFHCVQLLVTPRTVDPRLLCPWNSSGKNTGVGCHALLQGIFPTEGSNPGLLCLLHCSKILYCWATREAPDHSAEFLVICVHTSSSSQYVAPISSSMASTVGLSWTCIEFNRQYN